MGKPLADIAASAQKIVHGHVFGSSSVVVGSKHHFGQRRTFRNGSTHYRESEAKPKLAGQNGKVKERLEERDFILDVLNANTTKRDVKSYLNRFDPTKTKDRKHDSKTKRVPDSGPLHIALIKIRALDSLDDNILSGLAQTLSQLSRLGLSCVIVLDSLREHSETGELDPKVQRQQNIEQADRFVRLIHGTTRVYACRVHNALGVIPRREAVDTTVRVRDAVEVQFRDMLLKPLRRGMIPIVPPLGYTTDTQTPVDLDANDVVLALARQFAGLREDHPTQGPGGQFQLQQDPGTTSTDTSVDRIILLDPLGGLPSLTRPDRAHIFVNMEQEYGEIHAELSSSNGVVHPHVRNLDLLRDTLTLLPASSSAMITTPAEAAILRNAQPTSPAGGGVRTRRPRNPLLFNLLTDKPLISSSLPPTRINPIDKASGTLQLLRSPSGGASPATFLKRGMPVTILPAAPWTAPTPLDLRADPRVDWPRLRHLLEDSFGRPLDADAYLRRIAGRVAGLVVAGPYEGAAILTWELPPGVPPHAAPATQHARLVPYLDKFAVLRRSQGAGGVADIVFSAMVRTCFPDGVCWRSRKDNPVNKWYFERSVGSVKLPGTQWTMFWTTAGLEGDARRFADYEAVCRGVQPSWADAKR